MKVTPPTLLNTVIAQLRMSSGILALKLQKYAKTGQSVILTYHRVVPPSQTGEHLAPGMSVTPKAFQMHMRFLKRYFDIIPLKKLVETINTPSKKPGCAITFDDGYLDFYTNVYPILHTEKIPVTLFLPTAYTGTKQWFWTDRLATILKNSPHITSQSFPDKLSSSIARLAGPLPNRITMAIDLLKPFPYATIAGTLDTLECCCDTAIFQKRTFLDWYECRTLKNSGHIAFGSRSPNDAIPASEHCYDFSKELSESKKKLITEEVADRSFIPFSFPDGTSTDKNAQLARDTGYHCAVTSEHGWVHETSNLFSLNRIAIDRNRSATKALLFSTIAG